MGGAGEGEGQNQLALARQLSMRKLWCEQPDVISSGILQVLTDEERNLQEVGGFDVFVQFSSALFSMFPFPNLP